MWQGTSANITLQPEEKGNVVEGLRLQTHKFVKDDAKVDKMLAFGVDTAARQGKSEAEGVNERTDKDRGAANDDDAAAAAAARREVQRAEGRLGNAQASTPHASARAPNPKHALGTRLLMRL